MIIDAHHHLWQFNEADYGWMDASMSVLKRDYLPEELEAEAAKAGVKGTVVVQARQKEAETAWLLELAEPHPLIRGVVGWLDLRSPRLEEKLAQYAPHPKLAGLRHVIHDEPDDDFMLLPEFQRGIGLLKEAGLTYDLLLFPKHLPNALTLVQRFPEQAFVLDHISKPLIRDGVMEPWRSDLRALAQCGHVYCKLSGMVTEADHSSWAFKDLLPYMEAVYEAFGPDRLMMGSDWPVCRLAGPYKAVMDVTLRFLRGLPADEQRKITHENAISFYQLSNQS